MKPQPALFKEILNEVKRLKKTEPMPVHICSQVGVIQVSCADLMRLALLQKYSGIESRQYLRLSAITAASNLIRFIQNLDKHDNTDTGPGSVLGIYDGGSAGVREGENSQADSGAKEDEPQHDPQRDSPSEGEAEREQHSADDLPL